jgi:hypothetical protein
MLSALTVGVLRALFVSQTQGDGEEGGVLIPQIFEQAIARADNRRGHRRHAA